MNLKIRSGIVQYNNKILVSDGNFSLGKNKNVNLMTPAIKNHKTNSLETPAIKSHKDSHVVAQTSATHRLRTKVNYPPLRGENCLNSFFNWVIYDMVHISMNILVEAGE